MTPGSGFARDGHSVDCWRWHDGCALAVAYALLRERAAELDRRARRVRDARAALERARVRGAVGPALAFLVEPVVAEARALVERQRGDQSPRRVAGSVARRESA